MNTAATTLVPALTTSNILLSAANGTIGGSTLDYAYRTEFANSWSFDVRRELGANWVVQAGYLGSHISGADNSTYRNVPLAGPGPIDSAASQSLSQRFQANSLGWLVDLHSGTPRLEKRLSSGLTLHTSYTWSKSMDDAFDVGSTFAEANIPQGVRNIRAESALSSFDLRHRLVFSYSYALPVGAGFKGPARRLVQGWSVTGLGSAQSGAPFTVILPIDNANIGAGPVQRPNLIANPNANAPRTAQQWFNTSAFQMPAQFTFGNASRNVVFGDNEVNVDCSLHKETSITERSKAEFRPQVFNLFNHTTFADVAGRTAFTSTFGRYASAQNSRQIQFAVKLLF